MNRLSSMQTLKPTSMQKQLLGSEGLLYFALFCFTIGSISQVSPIFNTALNCARVILFLGLFYRYVLINRADKFTICVLFWQLAYFISAAVNGHLSLSMFFYAINAVSVVLIVKDGVLGNPQRFVRCARNWFLLMLAINLVHLLLLPPVVMPIGAVYFLGIRVSFTLYCVAAIFFSFIYDLSFRKVNEITVCELLSILLSAATLLHQEVMTGLAVLFAICLFYFLLRKQSRFPYLVMIVAIVMYIIVAQTDSIQFLGSLLTGVGKDITFSSRTYIWNQAISNISTSPLIGYGIGDFPVAAFGGGVHPAHNDVLNTLIQGGFIALICELCFFICIFGNKKMQMPGRRFDAAIVLGLILMMTTEIISNQNSYIFIMAFLFYEADYVLKKRGAGDDEVNM